ncbi:hypothetical protein GEMMAAP_00800 [Gemmatimonas phototrophica]|uniref:RES domain-containing protein n=2 Tax=Gemmatimonas phototrophica TaxID=1379270 RepID=A0A143BGN8_9BACT|nr:hypothetical protein GEMMAAP_00800 [Gemmatimonas phototrophica]
MHCEGASRRQLLQLAPWRVVESQHQVSTRKLVDSAAEQELLETLVDRVKPPVAVGGRLHYLLSTPFRYPPLRYGSRFGARQERGIWYGAVEQRTAFAEVAYYRLLFLEGTRASLDVVMTELSAFTVRMRSDRGVRLDQPPFLAHRDAISSPVSYAESQALGRAMREAGVELFVFVSARDSRGGLNAGAFTPAVFRAAKPQHFQRWHCTATRNMVEFVRGDLTGDRDVHTYAREQFLVEGVLPMPGV